MNTEFEEELRHMVSGWQGCECVLDAGLVRFTNAASPARKSVGVTKCHTCVRVKKCEKPHMHACFVSCSNEQAISCTE